MDRFLAASVPVCMHAPAVQCVDQGFAFADADRDGKLSLVEVRTLQGEVDGWVKANADRLPPAERQRLLMGLIVRPDASGPNSCSRATTPTATAS